MILDQPHSGANPVLIYERVGPGLYKVKISVTLVSLLHDFIVTHPNVLHLYDIGKDSWPWTNRIFQRNLSAEVSLQPSPENYHLEQPRSIPWHTCRLHGCSGTQQMMQYAELSFVNTQQTSPQDTRMHFTHLLLQLKFSIRFHVSWDHFQWIEDSLLYSRWISTTIILLKFIRWY